jgi:hypothetical protein
VEWKQRFNLFRAVLNSFQNRALIKRYVEGKQRMKFPLIVFIIILEQGTNLRTSEWQYDYIFLY